MKKLIITLATAALFCACSDDSSTSAGGDSSVASIYELGTCNNSNRGESKYVENMDCYYVCVSGEWVADNASASSSSSAKHADAITSSDTHADAITSSNSSSAKSSSSEVSIYTTAMTTLTITLTDYRQLKAMDEKDAEDGEPRISFVIKTNKDGVYSRDSIKSTTIDLGNDIGYWTGSKSVTATLSKDINVIQICPVFVDEDAFFDDEEYTSKTCYPINDVGQKIGMIIEQTDDGSAYYTMDWEVSIEY